MSSILYSGAAEGADLAWGWAAERAGHEVVHFSFEGHKNKAKPNQIKILSQQELDLADSFLKEANKVLQRRFPTRNQFVNNLLRRDYYQVKDSDAVYAISSFDNKGLVEGGTAWAVEIAKILSVKTIYLIEQNQKTIYKWAYDLNLWIEWPDLPPKPSGKWTGIGTREINTFGLLAISEIFKE